MSYPQKSQEDGDRRRISSLEENSQRDNDDTQRGVDEEGGGHNGMLSSSNRTPRTGCPSSSSSSSTPSNSSSSDFESEGEMQKHYRRKRKLQNWKEKRFLELEDHTRAVVNPTKWAEKVASEKAREFIHGQKTHSKAFRFNMTLETMRKDVVAKIAEQPPRFHEEEGEVNLQPPLTAPQVLLPSALHHHSLYHEHLQPHQYLPSSSLPITERGGLGTRPASSPSAYSQPQQQGNSSSNSAAVELKIVRSPETGEFSHCYQFATTSEKQSNGMAKPPRVLRPLSADCVVPQQKPMMLFPGTGSGNNATTMNSSHKMMVSLPPLAPNITTTTSRPSTSSSSSSTTTTTMKEAFTPPSMKESHSSRGKVETTCPETSFVIDIDASDGEDSKLEISRLHIDDYQKREALAGRANLPTALEFYLECWQALQEVCRQSILDESDALFSLFPTNGVIENPNRQVWKVLRPYFGSSRHEETHTPYILCAPGGHTESISPNTDGMHTPALTSFLGDDSTTTTAQFYSRSFNDTPASFFVCQKSGDGNTWDSFPANPNYVEEGGVKEAWTTTTTTFPRTSSDGEGNEEMKKGERRSDGQEDQTFLHPNDIRGPRRTMMNNRPASAATVVTSSHQHCYTPWKSVEIGKRIPFQRNEDDATSRRPASALTYTLRYQEDCQANQQPWSPHHHPRSHQKTSLILVQRRLTSFLPSKVLRFLSFEGIVHLDFDGIGMSQGTSLVPVLEVVKRARVLQTLSLRRNNLTNDALLLLIDDTLVTPLVVKPSDLQRVEGGGGGVDWNNGGAMRLNLGEGKGGAGAKKGEGKNVVEPLQQSSPSSIELPNFQFPKTTPAGTEEERKMQQEDDTAEIEGGSFTIAMRHRFLTQLHLSDNQFTLVIGKQFLDFLTFLASPQLQYLELSNSPFLNDSFVKKVEALMAANRTQRKKHEKLFYQKLNKKTPKKAEEEEHDNESENNDDDDQEIQQFKKERARDRKEREKEILAERDEFYLSLLATADSASSTPALIEQQPEKKKGENEAAALAAEMEQRKRREEKKKRDDLEEEQERRKRRMKPVHFACNGGMGNEKFSFMGLPILPGFWGKSGANTTTNQQDGVGSIRKTMSKEEKEEEEEENKKMKVQKSDESTMKSQPQEIAATQGTKGGTDFVEEEKYQEEAATTTSEEGIQKMVSKGSEEEVEKGREKKKKEPLQSATKDDDDHQVNEEEFEEEEYWTVVEDTNFLNVQDILDRDDGPVEKRKEELKQVDEKKREVVESMVVVVAPAVTEQKPPEEPVEGEKVGKEPKAPTWSFSWQMWF